MTNYVNALLSPKKSRPFSVSAMSTSYNRILVVLGTTRDGRHGIKVAKLMMTQLKLAGLEPTLVDPLEIDPPVLRQPLHFRSQADQEAAPQWMKTIHEQIK